MTPGPTSESFWAEPGRIVAGPYPGTPNDRRGTREKVEAVAAAGVTLFLDLTVDGELDPYAEFVRPPARHVRHPIVDMGVPLRPAMSDALDATDDELERGGVVYVHCRGGCGRTGTVVGCWWVRHGMHGDDAVARYQELSRVIQQSLVCPQTDAQRALIRGWSEGG